MRNEWDIKIKPNLLRIFISFSIRETGNSNVVACQEYKIKLKTKKIFFIYYEYNITLKKNLNNEEITYGDQSLLSLGKDKY